MASLCSSAFFIVFIVGIASANNSKLLSFYFRFELIFCFNLVTRSYKGYWCDYNRECSRIIGDNSLCIANECQCIPHYHINYETNCVKDRGNLLKFLCIFFYLYIYILGLKESCFSDDECYWGPEMVDKIVCNLGVCDCAYGYTSGPGRICVRYCKKYIFF